MKTKRFLAGIVATLGAVAMLASSLVSGDTLQALTIVDDPAITTDVPYIVQDSTSYDWTPYISQTASTFKVSWDANSMQVFDPSITPLAVTVYTTKNGCSAAEITDESAWNALSTTCRDAIRGGLNATNYQLANFSTDIGGIATDYTVAAYIIFSTPQGNVQSEVFEFCSDGQVCPDDGGGDVETFEILSINPQSGGPYNTATIEANGLEDIPQADLKAIFGSQGEAAIYQVDLYTGSPDQILVGVPGSGSYFGDVSVTLENAGVPAAGSVNYTYMTPNEPFEIWNVIPQSGEVGDAVTIEANGLEKVIVDGPGGLEPNLQVLFGTVPASYSYEFSPVGPDIITATAPSGPVGEVTVSLKNVDTGATADAVNPPGTLFTYIVACPDDSGLTVNSADDAIAPDCNCTLREAVLAASTNAVVDGCGAGVPGMDIISFQDDYTINLTSGAMDITDAVTIEGAGVTIDSNVQDGVFNFNTDSQITINGLTFTNNNAADPATTVIEANSRSNCTLNDVTVTNLNTSESIIDTLETLNPPSGYDMTCDLNGLNVNGSKFSSLVRVQGAPGNDPSAITVTDFDIQNNEYTYLFQITRGDFDPLTASPSTLTLQGVSDAERSTLSNNVGGPTNLTGPTGATVQYVNYENNVQNQGWFLTGGNFFNVSDSKFHNINSDQFPIVFSLLMGPMSGTSVTFDNVEMTEMPGNAQTLFYSVYTQPGNSAEFRVNNVDIVNSTAPVSYSPQMLNLSISGPVDVDLTDLVLKGAQPLYSNVNSVDSFTLRNVDMDGAGYAPANNSVSLYVSGSMNSFDVQDWTMQNGSNAYINLPPVDQADFTFDRVKVLNNVGDSDMQFNLPYGYSDPVTGDYFQFTGTFPINDFEFSGNAFGMYLSSASSAAEFNNAVITNNTPRWNPIVNTYGGALTFNNSVIADNDTQSTYAGAVSMNNGALTVNESAIVGNATQGSGGAIYQYGGDINVVNSTIAQNSAAMDGGAIYLVGAPTGGVKFSTIADNTTTGGAGGGIYAQLDAPGFTLENSILANNSAGSGNDCYANRAEIQSLGDNILSDWSDVSCLLIDSMGNMPSQEDLLNVDPVLDAFDASGYFYPLTAGSPAVNAAHEIAGIVVDQIGNVRPTGSASDIGAIESPFAKPDAPSRLRVSARDYKNGDPDGSINFDFIQPSDTSSIAKYVLQYGVLDSGACTEAVLTSGISSDCSQYELNDPSLRFGSIENFPQGDAYHFAIYSVSDANIASDASDVYKLRKADVYTTKLFKKAYVDAYFNWTSEFLPNDEGSYDSAGPEIVNYELRWREAADTECTSADLADPSNTTCSKKTLGYEEVNEDGCWSYWLDCYQSIGPLEPNTEYEALAIVNDTIGTSVASPVIFTTESLTEGALEIHIDNDILAYKREVAEPAPAPHPNGDNLRGTMTTGITNGLDFNAYSDLDFNGFPTALGVVGAERYAFADGNPVQETIELNMTAMDENDPSYMLLDIDDSEDETSSATELRVDLPFQTVIYGRLVDSIVVEQEGIVFMNNKDDQLAFDAAGSFYSGSDPSGSLGRPFSLADKAVDAINYTFYSYLDKEGAENDYYRDIWFSPDGADGRVFRNMAVALKHNAYSPYHDLLDDGTGLGAVRMQTFGVAPYRYVVVDYDNWKYSDQSGTVLNDDDYRSAEMQLKIYESQCYDIDGDGYYTGPECGADVELDCDDTNAAINPGAVEVCDLDPVTGEAIDNNCNGVADNADSADVTGTTDPALDTLFIDPDTGQIAVDAATGEPLYEVLYADFDADDFGAGTGYRACPTEETIPGISLPLSAYSTVDGDCWDVEADAPAGVPVDPDGLALYTAAEVNPAAPEICNGFDENCSGVADENLDAEVRDIYAGAQECYEFDETLNRMAYNLGAEITITLADGTSSTVICDGVENGGDDRCYAQATGVCLNGVYESISEIPFLVFLDSDGDTYNTDLNLTECFEGQVDDNYIVPQNEELDCNDADGAESPGATDVCDGDVYLDLDCNPNNNTIDCSSQCGDLDGDGYYADEFEAEYEDKKVICQLPVDIVYGDCDDNDPNTNPGAAEPCTADGKDNNCDGVSDTDADGDTFYLIGTCTSDDGRYDCVDTDAAINPDGIESCNGYDDDCDGLVDDNDDSLTDGFLIFRDSDADGFGDANSPLANRCQIDPGYDDDDLDCNDADGAVNPDATEICDNLIDDDCNGFVDSDDPACVVPEERDAAQSKVDALLKLNEITYVNGRNGRKAEKNIQWARESIIASLGNRAYDVCAQLGQSTVRDDDSSSDDSSDDDNNNWCLDAINKKITWNDDNEIACQNGQQVFNEEKEAVRKILKAMDQKKIDKGNGKKNGLTAAGVIAANEAIDLLQEADRVIVEVAVENTVDPNDTVPNPLDPQYNVQQEWQVIQIYRQAWQNTCVDVKVCDEGSSNDDDDSSEDCSPNDDNSEDDSSDGSSDGSSD